jgi:hypothetical protein
MTPVSVWRGLRAASPGLETIRVVVRTDEARKATGEAGKLHSINAWLAASESRQCLGCLTPSLLHALASVHEPERWLSPLARRPGAPQRTRPSRRCRGSLQEEPTDTEFPHPTRRASDHMTVEASAARGGHTTTLTPSCHWTTNISCCVCRPSASSPNAPKNVVQRSARAVASR